MTVFSRDCCCVHYDPLRRLRNFEELYSSCASLLWRKRVHERAGRVANVPLQP